MDWSDLPPELLITIAGKLTEFTDHLRFRSVCSHWRSSSLSAPLRLPRQLPWLALPSTSSAIFYSLSENRIYTKPPPAIPDNSNIFGSASGWFLSLSGRNCHITASLVNPFTGALISLPSPDPGSALSYVAADTLVWDRSDNVVVAACRTRQGVFYCRLGEAEWTSIHSQRRIMAGSITFHEGRFYLFRTVTCETIVLDGETLEEIVVIAGPNLDISLSGANLFVSSGELMLLVKSTWMHLFPESELQFYKIRRANLNAELVEWVEVDDIGDRALFVDDLHCFSVEVGDNSMLRRNCIYSANSRNSGVSGRNLSRMYSISILYVGNSSCEQLEGALSNFPAVSLHDAVAPPSWVMPFLN